MVRGRVFLHIFRLLLRSDDLKSFKLEYLSAGRNQPDAFTVSVNPLILFRPPLVFLFEPWLTLSFPRRS